MGVANRQAVGVSNLIQSYCCKYFLE